MKDRILSIIEQKHLSVSQFADSVGIQRSTFHHIISGRNNPSLDIITKIYATYPDIDLVWLMTGKHQSDSSDIVTAPSVAVQQELFTDNFPPITQPENPSSPTTGELSYEYQNLREVERPLNNEIPRSAAINYERKIAQIIVVFSDGTTEFYK